MQLVSSLLGSSLQPIPGRASKSPYRGLGTLGELPGESFIYLISGRAVYTPCRGLGKLGEPISGTPLCNLGEQVI